MAEATVNLASEPDFQLGDWQICPSANELVFGHEHIRLEPRVMQVLVALARHAGGAVSREQLLRDCWGTTAVTDDALIRCVSQLRKVFGNGVDAVSIETVSKVGYRLVLPSKEDREPTARSRPSRFPSTKSSVFGLAVIAILAIAVVIASSNRSSLVNPGSPLRLPVTTMPGPEQWPAISPAGGQVAYAWQGESGNSWDLYVQPIGSDTRLQLTEDYANDKYPVWSPDGSQLAFVRTGETGCGIYRVSAVGGPVSRVTKCGAGGVATMDWSSTGDHIVYTTREQPLSPAHAFLIDLSDNSEIPTITPANETDSVEDVSFSPDGTILAYTLVVALGVEDIYLYSLNNGDTRRITFDNLKIHGFDWLPDGSGFVMSSNRGGEFALWNVSLNGDATTPIQGTVGGADEPKISRDGRLVYEAWRSDAEITRLELATGELTGTLVSSTRYDWDAQRSPDGTRIAFISDRSGAAEVWIADFDGRNTQRVTDFGGPYTHTPRWSPNGKQIAFATPADGNFDIYVVTPGALPVKRLTEHSAEDFAPAWSSDGRALYFGSTRSGDWQVWRLILESGELTQMTSDGGRAAQESPNGQWLYYTRIDRPGLWRISLETDARIIEQVLTDLTPVDWNNWQALETALYYVQRSVPSEPEIVRLDFQTRSLRRIRKMPDLLYKSGLWVAPDEKEALITTIKTSEADILLVELGDQ